MSRYRDGPWLQGLWYFARPGRAEGRPFVVGSYYVYMMPHGRAPFPERLVGRAVTTVNLSTFLGTGVMQAVTGFIIDAIAFGDDGAPDEAYRAVFGFLAVVTVVAALLYSRIEDVTPSAERARKPTA